MAKFDFDFRDSIVASIPACHAGDRGSIPRRGENFLLASFHSKWTVDSIDSMVHLCICKWGWVGWEEERGRVGTIGRCILSMTTKQKMCMACYVWSRVLRLTQIYPAQVQDFHTLHHDYSNQLSYFHCPFHADIALWGSLIPSVGIEPTTTRLRVVRSTD